MCERRHHHRPPLVDLAHDVGARHPDLVEEDLVEPRLPGDLDQRSDGDAGALHVDEEERQPAVLGRRGIGADDQDAPVGVLREAGPDLLPGDRDLVAAHLAAGPDGRQVGPRVGLGEALTPDVLARQDTGQEAPLLFLGAAGDQCRTDEAESDRQVDAVGRFGARALLVEDELLDDRRPATAVLARPRDAGPSPPVQPRLPRLGGGDLLERRRRLAVGGCRPAGRQVGGDPRAHLGAKCLFLRCQPEVHARALSVTSEPRQAACRSLTRAVCVCRRTEERNGEDQLPTSPLAKGDRAGFDRGARSHLPNRCRVVKSKKLGSYVTRRSLAGSLPGASCPLTVARFILMFSAVW